MLLLLPGGTPWTTSEGVSRQASWQTRPKRHILCLELFLCFLGDLQGMNDSARRSREKSSGMEESLKNLPWKNTHLFRFVSFSLTFLFLSAFSPLLFFFLLLDNARLSTFRFLLFLSFPTTFLARNRCLLFGPYILSTV